MVLAIAIIAFYGFLRRVAGNVAAGLQGYRVSGCFKEVFQRGDVDVVKKNESEVALNGAELAMQPVTHFHELMRTNHSQRRRQN